MRILLIICLGWSTALSADNHGSPVRNAEGNIVPTPRGEVCVAPAEEMRREHMVMLLHQRDKTVQQGIRDKQASLVACINCHATPDASGKVVRSNDKRFFCTACHVAASVKIDCFQCHTDRPADTISNLGLLTNNSGLLTNASPVINDQQSLPFAMQFRLDIASAKFCQ